jgi:hypothetical protein
MFWREGVRHFARLASFLAWVLMLVVVLFAFAGCKDLTADTSTSVATPAETSTTTAASSTIEPAVATTVASVGESGAGSTDSPAEATSTISLFMYAVPFSTTTTALLHNLTLFEGANGVTRTVRVGQVVYVCLEDFPDDGLTAEWVDLNRPTTLRILSSHITPDYLHVECQPLVGGTMQLRVRLLNSHGAVQRIWSVNLSVVTH